MVKTITEITTWLLNVFKRVAPVGIILSISGFMLLQATSASIDSRAAILQATGKELKLAQENLVHKADAERKAVLEHCLARQDTRLKSFNHAAAGGAVEGLEGLKQRFAVETCVDPFPLPAQK